MKVRILRYWLVLLAVCLVLCGAGFVRRVQAATFIVFSVSDEPDADLNDGVCKTANNLCTLRAAIQQANALPGADIINFDLGVGTPAIPLTSELPQITGPITIDGNTGGTPRVQLVGSNAGAAHGLRLAAGSGGSQIRSLVIRNFRGDGILILSNGNTVQNCFIGTDASGTTVQTNLSDGIFVFDTSSNNLIGGTAIGARNLISGNGNFGIFINSGSGNLVQGNYIGTNVSGTGPLGNVFGGLFVGGTNQTIGGTTLSAGNLISGNNGSGIQIQGSGIIVQGNHIGTNAAGNSPVANGQRGVFIDGSFGGNISNNTIGGVGVGSRNFISGNGGNGVEINGSGATNNYVQGNFIGTDINGTSAIPNGFAGVAIGSTNNTVGGTTAESRNIISGNNREGVFISAGGNQLEGNYIGTNVNGTAAVHNGLPGVSISNAPNNVIGGTNIAARNLISGNNDSGILISGSSATGNLIQGNFIGTDINGTMAIPNAFAGVAIGSTNNTVGGTLAGARNLISGNSREGIYISAGGNQVQGNYIGTNVNGTAAIPNAFSGVALVSTNNTIGGTLAGARNLISGNSREGIYISAGGNKVQGNFIGTNASGTAALGNFLPGIDIDNAPDNMIGGSDADDGATDGVVMARNIISGSSGNNAVVTPGHGVRIRGAGASGNQVRGNFIGTDVTGTSAIGNFYDGVDIEGAPNNVIGGTVGGARNVISGNDIGIGISSGANGNQVQGNFIGTDVTGTKALGNNEHGVSIVGGSTNCTVGGTVPGSGNLLSGNRFSGISIAQSETTGTVVQGNLIGTDVTGKVELGNGSEGLAITGSNSKIGGATAAARNIISGNNQQGIFIAGTGNNQIQGNFIGTDVTGTQALGNTLEGLLLFNTSSNGIGGANLGNTIAFNGGLGISIQVHNGGTSTGNAILGNSIFSNGGMGIDLNNDGVTLNDGLDPDTGPNNLQNFPVITSAVSNPSNNTTAVQGSVNSAANTTFNIEFFSSSAADPTGYGEGQTFRGSTKVTADASGNANFSVTLNAAFPGGHVVTATATDSSNNTSEFSQAVTVIVQTFTISGRVTNGQNGAGFPDVTVSLSGSQTTTTQTDASGNYSFTAQAGGNYTVTPSKTNFTFNPPSQTFSNLSANASANFVGTATPQGPTIFIEEGTLNQAVALDSVTHVRGPFHILTEHNFSGDHHTRLILFTSDLGLSQPDPSKLTVTAGGTLLTIENVGPLTGVPGLSASYIVVRLPDGLPPGDLFLVVTLNGVASTNSPTIAISP